MINVQPAPALTKIHTQAVSDITKTWKVGQQLNAVVERNANAQNNVLMRIGQTVLQAKSPVTLQAGHALKLLVTSAGDTPVLKILTTVGTQQLAAQNLKTFIARQQDLTGILPLSQKIINSPDTPKILKQLLIDLNQKLPTIDQAMQAKTLKTLVKNSGVFLESRLKQLQTASLQHNGQQAFQLTHDVKSQLLRISSQLNTVLPELTTSQLSQTKNLQSVIDSIIKQFIKGDINLIKLSTLLSIELPKNQSQLIQDVLTTSDKNLLAGKLKNSFTVLLNHLQQQTNAKQIQDKLASLLKNMDLLQELKTGIEGTLAKITTQQLTTLTRESDSLLLLLFGVYLKDKTETQLIQFRLQQEESAKDKSASSWTVELNFNFKQLGPVQARLRLRDNQLSTIFRAQQESTVKSISSQINLLNTALSQIGFDAINLNVTQGSLKQPSDIAKNVHLLDEKA